MRQQLLCMLVGLSGRLVQAIPTPLDFDIYQSADRPFLSARELPYLLKTLHIQKRTDRLDDKLKEGMKANLNVDPLTIKTEQSNPNGGGMIITAQRNGPESGYAAKEVAKELAPEVIRAYDQSENKPKGRNGKDIGPPMTTVDIGPDKVKVTTQNRGGRQQSPSEANDELMKENTRKNIQKSSDAKRYQIAVDLEADASKTLKQIDDQKAAMKNSALTPAEKQAAAAAKTTAITDQRQSKAERARIERIHAHPGKCSECEADLSNVKQATQGADTVEDTARKAVNGHLQASAGVTKANPGIGPQQACPNCVKKQENFNQVDTVVHPDTTVKKKKKSKRALISHDAERPRALIARIIALEAGF